MKDLILAIDQGTSSSRAMVFDANGAVMASSQQEFPQIYPENGWVEHDPEAIWASVISVCSDATSALAHRIAAAGVTNQRETTVVWERESGKPIYNAIVWQDRRTADRTDAMKAEGLEPEVNKRTGLLLDPYFSASKIAWILDHVPGARAKAEAGSLAFGTIESFLIFRLTGGKRHVSDATNAARTSLYNIMTGMWDDDLLSMFNVPRAILPDVLDNIANFGSITSDLLGTSIPILGAAGDQQAASIGQACMKPGMVKSTYGTGCFLLVNTGEKALLSKNKLLTTIAYALNGKCYYALEGSLFIAGAAIQWLRDEMGLIKQASDAEAIARSVPADHGVYMVPAFAGLGAPHWDPGARGAILGLTRASGAKELIRATLEAPAYQTTDLLKALEDDGVSLSELRIDGGMAANSWFAQFLADISGVKVTVPKMRESTAMGAAILAGIGAGLIDGIDNIDQFWQAEHSYGPSLNADARANLLAGWAEAVERVKSTG